jgi:putative restriction endonuclease
MDLIAQGVVSENFVEPFLDLLDTFNLYWSAIMPSGTKGNMAYPFPRLKTDGFWHLIPKPGYENQIDREFSSMTKLREVCAGAKLDEDLFQLMCNPGTREQLRGVLVSTYFAPEMQPVVTDQGSVNVAAYDYGKMLLKEVEEADTSWASKDDEKSRKVRDQGFRKAMVELYEHRCALCGIRMLTPEGHTVVEAAHIKPWSKSHDDTPPNGMALCRLCHWSFDEGLMSVSKEYHVLVSKRVQVEHNLPGHILTLSERTIFTPSEHRFWPAQENLHWHRVNSFRA